MSADFRQHFLIPSDVTYLNAATFSPMPIVAGQAGVAAIEKRTAAAWTTTASDFVDASEKLRALIANLWGTLPRNVALVTSVSYGVETAVKNIRLEPGDEIIVPQDDFPSDIYPWLEAAKRTGARVTAVARPADFDWTRAVLSQLESSRRAGRRTAVVSVPLCDWSDGTRFDLSAISAACRERGAKLAVDVSQSFGAVPIAVADFDPDFLFSVGYKWQLGPYGLSYLYVADRFLDGAPLENNWLNRRGSDDFARLVDYRDEYQDGARRFDSGERTQFHLTPMAIEATKLLKELGISAIHAHVNALVRELHERLSEIGFQLPPLERLSGHMLGARHRNWPDMGPLVKRLKERNIFVSARGTAMRIAPHLYNDRTDLDRLVEGLVYEIAPGR